MHRDVCLTFAEFDALEAVIEHCRGRLAGFKVPKRAFLVQDLPKNPSGKVLKRALRERVVAGAAQHPTGGTRG